MKPLQLLAALIAAVVALALTSCQNNGHIGNLYGEWAVDEATVDGTVDTGYPAGEMYLRFQSDVVVYSRFRGNTVVAQSYYGTWSRTDNTLTLDFVHFSDSKPIGEIPSQYLIPARAATTFTIEKETSRQIVMSFTDGDGRRVKFELRKII